MGFCSYQFYCSREYSQGRAQPLGRQMFPPVVLAWETFQKVTLIAGRAALQASKILMVRNCTPIWGAIRSTPGASPPCLDGRTGREFSACVSKGQTKSDRGRKALVSSLSTPPSRPGREACGRKMELVTFFLSYRWELTIPASLL